MSAALRLTGTVLLLLGLLAESARLLAWGEGPGTLAPVHRFAGSHKSASHLTASAGERLTYTILLRNAGPGEAVAQVTDRLPLEVSYLPGSAQPAALYDEQSATLTWADVKVPLGTDVSLSFDALANEVAASTMVINRAEIWADGSALERIVPILLIPGAVQAPPDIAGSRKLVEPCVVGFGENLSYTILLNNSGQEEIIVQVIDRLPAEISYLDGTAQPAALYDRERQTLSWTDIRIPPGSEVPLTYTAQARKVLAPATAINTARISSSSVILERIARVLVVPEPLEQGEHLATSHQLASPYVAGPGEKLAYTILLRNTGQTAAVAQVTNNLPAEIDYINGSALPPAAQDAGARTLSWTDVAVPPQSEVSLTFAATATAVTTPTMTINTAVIQSEDGSLERSTKVLLVPDQPELGSDLADSRKEASRRRVASGEELTFSVLVRNTGQAEATAQVTDHLPAQLAYKAGSAQPEATVDVDASTLFWDGVSVPAGGEVALTYAVTAEQVSAPTLVLNRAIIFSGDESLERQASVLVRPERPKPHPKLGGSRKYASRLVVAPGERFNYTIRLHNSGTAGALVTVTDPLPAEVSYVVDSARPPALYDEKTRTLAWTGVAVPVGGDASLSFAVAASEVFSATYVVNSATITAGEDSLTRSAETLLVPSTPDTDTTPPAVSSLSIDAQDVLTDTAVTLHISARDDVRVARMLVQEWQWTATPKPHWQTVQRSGWIPYAPDVPWTLQDASGAHYVGVWVADEAWNLSHLDARALDFASLVYPQPATNPLEIVPYLVHFPAGTDISAWLTPEASTGSFLAWYTGDLSEPLAVAASRATFTTCHRGAHLFVACTQPGAAYSITIQPGGGPRLPVSGSAMPNEAAASSGIQTNIAENAICGGPDGLLELFIESGLDPLYEAEDPGEMQTYYLPLVTAREP